MAYVDILFLVIIGIGFLAGLISNWWRRLFGLIIFVALLLVYYYGFHEYAWKWLEYDSFKFLHQVGVLQEDFISFRVDALETTFRVENVRDAFILLQNLGIASPGVLGATCDGFCQALCLFLFVIALIPVSFLLSLILYWIAFRWIIPKPARSGIFPSLLGGIFGIIENAIVAIVLITVLGYTSGVCTDVVSMAMKDQSSELAIFLCEKIHVLSYADLSYYAKYVELASGVMNPLSETSVVVRPIFETFAQTGFDPFNIISVTYVNDAGEEVRESFRTSFSNFISDLITKGIGKINRVLS